GGGRCNFTNSGASPAQYVSQNPHFCKSALSRYTQHDFIQLVESHGIAYHEKKLGQLFCDISAKDIVEMLEKECSKAGVEVLLSHKVQAIKKDVQFTIHSGQDNFTCDSLVIATGGLSIPKIGATDFGYRIAKQFGLNLIPTSPALDGFRFSAEDLKRFGDLTGVSADSILTCNKVSFRENILFTHAGLSGPAALQASLYWNPGDPLFINFLPDFKPHDLMEWFKGLKEDEGRSEIRILLSTLLPKRLADRLCQLEQSSAGPISKLSEKTFQKLCYLLQNYEILPESTIGYGKAEVTKGGVDTNDLSSQTMEAKKIPGLYFIGEVLDVTGWLGGYNFQWAWSSGWAAGQVV
ncbi:MAG TPA: NAD(P)/FAD-dependent oxidoreductase, partial [bacterium]